ncbi:MAG: phosphatase PAP2 family protein [Deltaproteobacteria bacterium]|nr:phosphatase PAP2 family protein [Deltaproteobacteria bacterium]
MRWVPLVILLASGPARADEVFDLQAEVDAPVIATSLAIAILPELVVGQLDGPACLRSRCDRRDVPWFDRWAVGRASPLASIISDVLVLAIPVAGLSIDLATERGVAFWQDAAVVFEAYAIDALLVSLTKFAVRRPRPYVYDPARPMDQRGKPGAALSFFSGHASLAFTGATAFAEVFRRRHDGVAVPVVYASGLGLAAVVALCRILAGKHYLSDVLVGAAVGASLGILVPALHDRSAVE